MGAQRGLPAHVRPEEATKRPSRRVSSNPWALSTQPSRRRHCKERGFDAIQRIEIEAWFSFLYGLY